MTIRVLLADDHQLVRAGLRSLLAASDDLEVVGEAADGDAAIRLTRELEPDVVLMDLSMPGTDGIEATKVLQEQGTSARIVVLTSFTDRTKVRAAVAAGAIGYALKDSEPDQLLAAIRAAAAGQAPLDPRITSALLPEPGRTEPADLLSSREREVLQLATTGLPNKQIARRLGIAERTVKVHLTNVYRAIGVTDRMSAALWARDNLPS